MAAPKTVAYKGGDVLDITVAADYLAGQPLQHAGNAGYLATDVDNGDSGALNVCGIARGVKVTTVTGTAGDYVYWDADGDPVGGTAGTGGYTMTMGDGDFCVGRLTADAAAGDTHVKFMCAGLGQDQKTHIGMHDWGVGATGVLLDGTDPDMVLQVAGRINATLAAGAYATAYNQLAITATQSANVSAFTSWNELYITGGTIDLGGSSNYASVWAHVEISGTVTTPAGIGHISGLWATVISPATFTNDAVVAGCYVTSDMATGLTNNGTLAAYACFTDSGKEPWDAALLIDGADSVIKFASGTAYEDGVKITSSVFGESSHDLNCDAILRCYIGATAYYIPMCAAAKVTNE